MAVHIIASRHRASESFLIPIFSKLGLNEADIVRFSLIDEHIVVLCLGKAQPLTKA